jgi:hypothetical protein
MEPAMGRARAAFVSSLTLLSLVFLVSPSYSAITVYTSLASFLAAAPPGTALVADFETRATGPTLSFVEGGLTFSKVTGPGVGNLYIIGPTDPGGTSPLPTTKMLSAAGYEDFMIVVNAGWTQAFGFELLTNRYAPGTATLFDESGAVLATHQPTQAPNTVGFVGFVATGPPWIARVRWTSVDGDNQNTALDNIHIEGLGVTPTRSVSWGRIKSLYR